jgi:hypothetical protein
MDIVRKLHQMNPIFHRLGHQRISEWRDGAQGDGEFKWKAKTLKQVQKGNQPGGHQTKFGVLISQRNMTN